MAEEKSTPKEIKKVIVPPAKPVVSQPSPPMFVKVERYREIIQNIEQLRSYAISLRDALEALADVEKELKVGMDIAHKALDRLNAIITSLDLKLLKVQGIETPPPAKPAKDIESYIKGVYQQIERLKGELEAI